MMVSMDDSSPNDFELPVFEEPQREPEPIGYEKAVREFEEISATFRLGEAPFEPGDIPEFRM